MVCIGQLVPGDVALDKQGLLDDPQYIARAGRAEPSRQNVASLSASVSAALLAQFVSLTAHPGSRGVPAPLRYILSTHTLEHSTAFSGARCPYENATAAGDGRTPVVEHRNDWRQAITAREKRRTPLRLRALAAIENQLQRAIIRLD